jgi:hypothetical protein
MWMGPPFVHGMTKKGVGCAKKSRLASVDRSTGTGEKKGKKSELEKLGSL